MCPHAQFCLASARRLSQNTMISGVSTMNSADLGNSGDSQLHKAGVIDRAAPHSLPLLLLIYYRTPYIAQSSKVTI